MTAPIPNAEPASVNAGDTVKWLKSLADYPASQGWALTYTFINQSGKFTVSATAAGDEYLVAAAASASASWAAGTYDWRAQVSKSGEVYTVGSGRMVVQSSFGASTLDGRSQARRMLEAVEATLEGRATSAVAEYQIAGRQLKHIPIPELLALRDRMRADVAREDDAAALAAGFGPRGRILVRFGP